jgi:hypothetical protein
MISVGNTPFLTQGTAHYDIGFVVANAGRPLQHLLLLPIPTNFPVLEEEGLFSESQIGHLLILLFIEAVSSVSAHLTQNLQIDVSRVLTLLILVMGSLDLDRGLQLPDGGSVAEQP